MGKLTGKAKAKARAKDRAEQFRKHKKYLRELADSVRKHGDPILKQKCEPVVKGDDTKFILDWQIKDDRGEPVNKAGLLKKVLVATENGVGLAAPQVGVAKRAFVLRLDREIKNTDKVEVFINPEYVSKSEAMVIGVEGCLSYPDVYTNVERHATVKIKYLDEHFKQQEKEFEGFPSRVVQHEMDHLDGICRVGEAWEKRSEEKPEEATPAPTEAQAEEVVNS